MTTPHANISTAIFKTNEETNTQFIDLSELNSIENF